MGGNADSDCVKFRVEKKTPNNNQQSTIFPTTQVPTRSLSPPQYSSTTIPNMTKYGAPYSEIAQLFQSSTPVDNSAITITTTIFTIFLLLLSFGSLSFTLLGDIKKKSMISYLISAIVASLSIGFSAVYVMNYVGVYI